ncbi:MAG TPA: glycosyltransferase [Stellaceae bacterium]|nr:glycosyltransferase [Stellaceae bacterium]
MAFAAAVDPRDREIAELQQRLARAEHEAAELRTALQRLDGEYQALKQRAKITAPPPRLPQPLATEAAYPLWIASRASAAYARADWRAERIAAWPHQPKIALGMILPEGTEAQVALTLRSLLLQVAGDWELHVAAQGKMPEPFAADPRIIWHRDNNPPTVTVNARLIEAPADWVALIDAGDQLAPYALFSVADALFRHAEWRACYSDEDRIDFNDKRSGPHFKPDFNLDLLRGVPYVGGLLVVRRDLFAELGGFAAERDGIEEYDLALRLAERLDAASFGHIADVLYHRLTVSGRSRRPVAEICADMPKVVQAHLDRMGIAATTETGAQPQFCRVRYQHAGPEPLVSIIIPTRDQLALLKRCVETVLQQTAYPNYEIIIVDNDSSDPEANAYLGLIEDKLDEIGGRLRVLRHPGAFNFSAMNNRAAREAAAGDYLCLLNNDAAPLDADWLSEMMALARRPEVGAVGAKLFYPDGRIQHAGIVLGVGWGAPAEHPYIGEPGDAFGYWGRLHAVQGLSAVTAACLVTRRSLYDEMGGLDEAALSVSYSDVDYCLKLRKAGHLVLWTPLARLQHDGSASLRSDVEQTALESRNRRFADQQQVMYRRWMPLIAHDPAYNRNLSSFGYGYSVEPEAAPTWDPEFRPRPRVLAYAADHDGCGEYRIIAPSRALFDTGCVHSHTAGRLLSPPEIARVMPDSIVLQRQLEMHQIEAIESAKQLHPVFRIFELDDLITDLPPKSPHRAAIPRDIAARLKRALSLCDRLVVSSSLLAERYGNWCGEAVMVPNYLEKSRWLGLEPHRRDGARPRVGWAGAIGHAGDLALIAGVVEATAREVDWVFFGLCPERLKPLVAEYHEWVPLRDYAKKLASLDLDLAVAPLEYHPFNDAKSNLRLLEYGVLGYPVVCTDIRPYRCGLPVRRVANRSRDWIAAIRELAADRDACRRAGEELRHTVIRDWMLEDHLADWQKAWLPGVPTLSSPAVKPAEMRPLKI